MAAVRGFASAMSEVISFRLNCDNPREARALEVLRAWSKQGHSTRYVMTEALLKLTESEIDLLIVQLKQLNDALPQISQLLEQVKGSHSIPQNRRDATQVNSELAGNFLVSVRMSAKPGLKLA